MKELEGMDFESLNELAMRCGKLAFEGIPVGDEKINFSLLDYCSLTDLNCKDVARVIKRVKVERTYEEMIYRRCFLDFVYRERFERSIIETPDEILSFGYAYGFKDGRYVKPTKEDVEYIFNLCNENNIILNSQTAFVALYRLAKGVPVLPLLNEVEKEENCALSKRR